MQTSTHKSLTAIMALTAAIVLAGCMVVAPDENPPGETPTTEETPPGETPTTDETPPGNTPTTTPFTKIADGTTVEGSSGSIERFDDRVELELVTHELEPGDAYSVWMMILNNPSECAQSPCGDNDFGNDAVGSSMLGAAGGIADENGSITLTVIRMVDDLDGTVFGNGLTNPAEAQIGIILRTHGPAITDSLDEQLSTLNGGCPPNECSDVQSLDF